MQWEELESLAENLRRYTEEAMNKIEVAPWIEYDVSSMKELYTELTLETITKTARGEEAEPVSSYSDLFKTAENNDEVIRENIPQKITSQHHVESERYRSDLMAKISTGLCDSCNEIVKENISKLCTEKKNINTGETIVIRPSKYVKTQMKAKTKKILLKGDPGMGKSTLMKKITYDWAIKEFTSFVLVFFVLLKLINSGDPIENIIIEQNPELKGLGITPMKLRAILDTFGNRCLLVMDGLDEHAPGKNEDSDVLNIIRREKLLDSNIIVSSRPHSTLSIEHSFYTIIRIDGFTQAKAENFARNILKDESKIQGVLKFNPADFSDDTPLHKCPILLSFMCLLVTEDDIDLSSKTIHIGEIYTRMVRCLYKKFTIRKGQDFVKRKFIQTLTELGKLAFDTLLSGHPLLQKRDVIKDIGPDAFDYGLLIGHEDSRRRQDETADIYVTFPHRSIQEFLGTFYFIMMLNAGKSIESLLDSDCKEPIFMMNPLFLHFCLWFLYSDQEYFSFENIYQLRGSLVSYCFKRIKFLEDVTKIINTYPGLDIQGAFKKQDDLSLKFFKRLFQKLYKGTDIIFPKSLEELKWILAMGSTHQHIIVPGLNISRINQTEVFIHGEDTHLSELVDARINVGRIHCQLTLSQVKSVNLPKFLCESMKTLNIYSNHTSAMLFDKPLPSSPHLAHLLMRNLTIHENALGALCAAVSEGHLPNLTDFSIINCKGVAGKLSSLFRSEWPQLSHLKLCEIGLEVTDLDTLSKHGSLFPNLKFLELSPNDYFRRSFFLEQTNLTSLFLGEVVLDGIGETGNIIPDVTNLGLSLKEDSRLSQLNHLKSVQSLVLYRCIRKASDLETLAMVKKNLKYTLHKLDISHSRGISGQMPLFLGQLTLYETILHRHSFPSLNSLILSDCGLNSHDLCSLAQASVEGRFPVLKQLDISYNDDVCSDALFHSSCQWNKLFKLNITGIRHQNIKSGSLQSLQELSLSDCNILIQNTWWPDLQILCVDKCSETNLKQIADASDGGYLPAVKTVCVHSDSERWLESTCQPSFARLVKSNISVHNFIPPHDPFSSTTCVCQSEVPHSSVPYAAYILDLLFFIFAACVLCTSLMYVVSALIDSGVFSAAMTILREGYATISIVLYVSYVTASNVLNLFLTTSYSVLVKILTITMTILYDSYSTVTIGTSYMFNAVTSGTNHMFNTVASGTSYMFNTVACGTSYMFSTVASGTSYMFSTVTSGTSYMFNAVTSGTNYMFNAVVSGTSYMFNTVASGISYVLNVVVSGPSYMLTTVASGTSYMFSTVTSGISYVLNVVVSGPSYMLTTVASGTSYMFSTVTSGISYVLNVVVSGPSYMLTTVASGTSYMFSTVTSGISYVLNVVVSGPSYMLTTVASGTSYMFSTVTSGISYVLNVVVSGPSYMLTTVASGTSYMFSTVTSGISYVLNVVVSGPSYMLTTVASGTSYMFSTVTSGISYVLNVVVSGPSYMLTTVASGTSYMFSTVTSGISYVLNVVVSGPSYMLTTVASGTSYMFSTVTSGISYVLNVVVSGPSYMLTTVASGTSYMFNTVTSGISYVLNVVVSGPSYMLTTVDSGTSYLLNAAIHYLLATVIGIISSRFWIGIIILSIIVFITVRNVPRRDDLHCVIKIYAIAMSVHISICALSGTSNMYSAVIGVSSMFHVIVRFIALCVCIITVINVIVIVIRFHHDCIPPVIIAIRNRFVTKINMLHNSLIDAFANALWYVHVTSYNALLYVITENRCRYCVFWLSLLTSTVNFLSEISLIFYTYLVLLCSLLISYHYMVEKSRKIRNRNDGSSNPLLFDIVDPLVAISVFFTIIDFHFDTHSITFIMVDMIFILGFLPLDVLVKILDENYTFDVYTITTGLFVATANHVFSTHISLYMCMSVMSVMFLIILYCQGWPDEVNIMTRVAFFLTVNFFATVVDFLFNIHFIVHVLLAVLCLWLFILWTASTKFKLHRNKSVYVFELLLAVLFPLS